MSLTDKIDKIFAQWDHADSPGCALGVIAQGELIYSRGYGSAHLEHNIPNTPTTVFHAASIAKQFIAYLTISLAQCGKLSLEDEVHKYIPELRIYDSPIRIHHLINHTSGLRDHWSLFHLAGWRTEDLKTTTDALDLIFRQQELNFSPGEQYLYCNAGYALLRIIIEQATQHSLRLHAHNEIFAPLKMQHTHFHDDHAEVVKNRAAAYHRSEDGSHRISMPVFNMVGEMGLFTTVNDLANWILFLEANRENNNPIVSAMISPSFLNNGQQTEYGGGLCLVNHRGLLAIRHNGNHSGYRADCVWFPDQRLGVVILGNVDSLIPLHDRADQVADLYLEQLAIPMSAKENSDRNAPKIETIFEPTPDQLSEYVGCYYSDELRAHHDIQLVNGQLRFRLYRALEDMDCRFKSLDSFCFGDYLTGEFTRNKSGRIDALLISTPGARNIECVKVATASTTSARTGKHRMEIPTLLRH